MAREAALVMTGGVTRFRSRRARARARKREDERKGTTGVGEIKDAAWLGKRGGVVGGFVSDMVIRVNGYY